MMAAVEIIDSEYIFTTDGQQIILTITDEGLVRVSLVLDKNSADVVYFEMAAGDAHLLGTKLRLAAKKAP